MTKWIWAAVLVSLPATGLAAPKDRAETVFQEARGYTVRIRTQITTPFLEDEQGSFSGAGFLVDAQRGWVLTNAHVVGQCPSNVQVAFANEGFKPARKLYVDSFTDMAVLEVGEQKGRKAAVLQGDRVPEVGEAVGIFGHPKGFKFTGTRGIISGKTDRMVVDLLQTDATIDHGNSGGPMIALSDGKIVGIATAGYLESKEDKVNFATPMKDVCRILDLLRRGTPADPPQLGASLLVDDEGSPTLEVGHIDDPKHWPLQKGDRIISVGRPSQVVRTHHELITALRGRRGSVPVRVVRSGREIDVEVHPVLAPAINTRRAVILDGALVSGLFLHDSSALHEPPGLVIQSVESGSAADAQHLENLDLLDTVDGQSFEDLESLVRYLDSRTSDEPIRIVLRRVSPNNHRWFDYHVRELPGESIEKIGFDSKLSTSEPAPR